MGTGEKLALWRVGSALELSGEGRWRHTQACVGFGSHRHVRRQVLALFTQEGHRTF